MPDDKFLPRLGEKARHCCSETRKPAIKPEHELLKSGNIASSREPEVKLKLVDGRKQTNDVLF